MNEFEFSQKVLSRLSKDFSIKEEVFGTHFDGRKKRIDAVLIPKDNSKWIRKDIKFGVEFKKPNLHLDNVAASKLIRQAYDYLYTNFGEYGTMPILICPLKIQENYCATNEMRFIRKILGRFGIGEIQNLKEYCGLTIVFHENHRIWSEKFGVEDGQRWNFNFNTK